MHPAAREFCLPTSDKHRLLGRDQHGCLHEQSHPNLMTCLRCLKADQSRDSGGELQGFAGEPKADVSRCIPALSTSAFCLLPSAFPSRFVTAW